MIINLKVQNMCGLNYMYDRSRSSEGVRKRRGLIEGVTKTACPTLSPFLLGLDGGREMRGPKPNQLFQDISREQ